MPADTRPYSVSQLNREARMLLESGLPPLWVEGEISNLATPRSGHWYFTLKDHGAQIRCAMFKQWNRHLTRPPQDGDQVLVRGRISLYEARGDYQLICEAMEDAGEGALRRQYEQLKARLEAEGLFDPDDKLPLPDLPRTIGVITSPSGAAVRDIINVLGRRDPAIKVIIYPALVQGEAAAGQIADAIALAGARNECDALIIGRGGGSLEDLWCFNEEIVAQAIHACPLPTISAVGHETDFTIADFVASMRAPTPSAAAELVSRDASDLMLGLRQTEQRLGRFIRGRLSQLQQQLHWQTQRLQSQHPERQLGQHAQRLDQLERRISRAVQAGLQQQRQRIERSRLGIYRHSPVARLPLLGSRVTNAHHQARQGMTTLLKERQQRFGSQLRTLQAVSPLATLERGYAVATPSGSKAALKGAATVKVGSQIEVRLAKGQLECTVDSVTES